MGGTASDGIEIDAPLLVEFPGGERQAIIFLIEEETRPRDFSIHRLGKYLLEVAELNDVTRVVPVVVFLHPGEPARQLRLGTGRATYMAVTYISCHLARLNALDYLESTNIVGRILLPCMDAPDDRRVDVVAKSIEGLMTLEANVHKQHKYAGFISRYAGLDDQGRVELMERTTRAPWSRNMKSWFDEAEEKGERGASPKARCLASLAARPRWCCGPWRGGSSVPQRRKKSVS